MVPHPIFEIEEVLLPLTMFNHEFGHSFIFDTKESDALTFISGFKKGPFDFSSRFVVMHVSDSMKIMEHH